MGSEIEIGWFLTTLIVKVGVISFLLLLCFFKKKELFLTKATTQTRSMIVLMGTLEAGAVAIFNFGLLIGDAILIAPIASALSVVTILMAIIFLKDKITKLQGFGIISAIFGIIATGF